MSDKTLASLTAAPPATGGVFYGTQGGADRKFTLTAAGAAMMEAAGAIKLDELAAPTDVTTLNATTSVHGLLPKLGGGTTNFLRADGSWAAPAGGGGSTIVRGSGVLQGYTVPEDEGEPATPPSPLTFTINDVPASGTNWTLTVNGANYYFSWYDTDPLLGGVWLDTTSIFGIPSNAVMAFMNGLNGLAITNLTVSNPSGNDILIESGDVGPTAFLAGNWAVSGGGYGASGTDPTSASGEISEIQLIAQDGTKTIRPIKAGIFDGSFAGVVTSVQFALKVGGTYYPIGNDLAPTSIVGEVVVGGYYAEWVAGKASASLVVRMTGSIPTGGILNCWVIAEQS